MVHWTVQLQCYDLGMPGAKIVPKTVYFSQSFIGSWITCPQRAGFELDGIQGKSSDATELGTGVHTAIECTMDDDWFDEDGRSPRQVGADWLTAEAEAGNFEWAKTKTLPTLLSHYHSCFDAFLEDVLPRMGEPVWIEKSFDMPLCVAPDGTVIRIKGTIDYEDSVLGSLDWKTAGRPWEPGKQKRRVQTAAYTMAKAWILLVEAFGEERAAELLFEQDPIDFTYVVFTKGPNKKPAQFMKTEGGPSEWKWLQRMALRLYANMESGVWALNDSTPLCSSKWCDAWDVCRGAVIESDPLPLGPLST